MAATAWPPRSTALRYVTDEVTAIVTVADDGGSSGRLRDEFGVLPPGDLRMALAALCSDSEWGHTWRDVLQHRFAGDGPLGGHALGNLLIVALWELHDDPVAGLDLVGRLLQAQGRVLPMAAVPLTIEADVTGLDPDRPGCRAHRQRAGAGRGDARRRCGAVRLVPADPPAYPESVAAIRSADWVVLGPGLVVHLGDDPPAGARARARPSRSTRARRLLVLNLDPGTGRDGRLQRRAAPRDLGHAWRPTCASTRCSPTPLSSTTRRPWRSSAPRLGAQLFVTPGGASRPTRRARPAALRGRLAGHSRHPETGPVTRGRMTAMAMTAKVKDELSRHVVTKPCCRKSEVAATLRFAGGLHIIGGRIVVEAELDTANAARRLRRELSEVYGHTPEVLVLAAGGLRKGSRYVVRVVQDGESLARQTGLIDSRGRPVRGLPPKVVSGSVCDAEAAWRGAFLAHGSLTEPGRSSALEVTCPGPEAALALVGAARRMGISAKAREVRGVDRVVIRDGDAIGAMLTRLGAHDAVLAWEERRIRREVRATANRLANFDDANLRRSARAAVAAGARVERALEILGDDIPDHLREAGELRLQHKQASLEELGQLAQPPMTKDAVAGRIRRLLAMADKRASDDGIPNTEAVLTPDMLDT